MFEYVTSKSTSGRDIFLFILYIYLLFTPALGACFWLNLDHISNTPSYMHTLFCSVSSLGFCCQLFVGACDGFLFFRDDSLAFLQSYKVTLEDVYTTINKKPYKDHSDGLTKRITLEVAHTMLIGIPALLIPFGEILHGPVDDFLSTGCSSPS